MRNFLILGQTGVGKSSFINAVFGINAAKVHEYKACTKVVKHYVYGTSFGDICLIDTPGFSEDTKDLDRKYLRMIRDYIMYDKVDTVIYLTPLIETRLRSSEKITLSLITNELGREIWNNSWLIFTFAAFISSAKLDQKCKERLDQIIGFLREITPDDAPFKRFKEVAIIDNEIQDWTHEGSAADQFLIEH